MVASEKATPRPDEHGLALKARGEGGDGRSADNDAECVGGDDDARSGDGAVLVARPQPWLKVLRDLRQQSHRDELGGSDAEAAEREREQRESRAGGAERRHEVTVHGKGKPNVGHNLSYRLVGTRGSPCLLERNRISALFGRFAAKTREIRLVLATTGFGALRGLRS